MLVQPGTEQGVPGDLLPGWPARPFPDSGVVNTTKRSGSNTGLERRRRDMVSKVSSLY